MSKKIKNRLLIIGAGKNGFAVMDIAKNLNIYDEIFFLDDNKNLKSSKIIGNIKKLKKIIKPIDKVVISIGNNQIRYNIYKSLNLKESHYTNIIHPSAIISKFNKIGIGVIIMANVVISSNSKIGKFSIINTSSNIDHDSKIGNFTHISPGVNIAGQCKIGDLTWIGIGSNIINDIRVGKNVIIGAGSLILKDINSNLKVFGVPAKTQN